MTEPTTPPAAPATTPPEPPGAEALRQQLIRNLHDAPRRPFSRAPLYDSMYAPLSDGTAARKLGAGFDVLAPGARVCPYHFHHAQEEMFVILEGSATLRVAGQLLPLCAGDVVFIPPGPEYPHQIINTSDAPLKYLSISTQERPEVCEYPDSDKIVVLGRGPEGSHRRAAGVDYWDGEP
jgi:uncharacterized cupin superfamily protein